MCSILLLFIYRFVVKNSKIVNNIVVRWQNCSSFESLWIELWLVWACKCAAMCGGVVLNPNCPKGQKRVGKTKSSSKQSFLFNDLVISHFLVLSLFFHLAGNGWVYEKLGISERFIVKPNKFKCELYI
jgi:hypothetical protein